IPGNHDRSFNKNREDAISPVVRALNKQNIHMFSDSGQVVLERKDKPSVALTHLPYWRKREEWLKPWPKEYGFINIGLYHGPVNNAKTDLDFRITSGIDIEEFSQFDAVFLGDIHK